MLKLSLALAVTLAPALFPPTSAAQPTSIQYIYFSESSQVFPLDELTVTPLATIQTSVVFQIFRENPDFIEVRVRTAALDDAGRSALGTLDNRDVFGTSGAAREGDTFSVAALDQGQSPDPVQARNLELNIATGRGGIEYPGEGLFVELLGMLCFRGDPRFNDCFASVGSGGTGGTGGSGGSTIFWSASDGDFFDETNWEPARVPGSDDTAFFDIDATYTVSIGSGATSRRAVVERGIVVFRDGGYSLQETSLSDTIRSLVVGTFLNEPAELTLANAALDSTHTAIGRDATSQGVLTVDGIGGFTIWQDFGRVSVGLNGNGTLNLINSGGASANEVRIGDNAGSNGIVNVEDAVVFADKGGGGGALNSNWSTGSIAVGLSGAGNLIIEAGSVLSQTASVGENAGSFGSVILERLPGSEGAPSQPARWETEDLTVGNSGMGDVLIDDSILVTNGDAVLGGQMTGDGTVTLTGAEKEGTWTLGGGLFVGHRGRGTLNILENNDLEVPGDLTIGTFEGAVGVVELRQQQEEPFFGSSLRVDGLLFVGVGGEGTLIVNGGLTSGPAFIPLADGEGFVVIDRSPTIWDAQSITLGSLERDDTGAVTGVQGEGTLTLRGGGLVLMNDTQLDVFAGSRIQGDGVIVQASQVQIVGGVVTPGVIIALTGEKTAGLKQGDLEQGRTLELGNNLVMEGGRIEVRVDGTAEGDFDQLIVTGDATLTDTVIAITFRQGFSPKIGDEFSVVVVEGSLTTQNVTFEIEGADPGFEFALAEADGALVVMTTGEAQSGGGCSAAPTVTAGGETEFGVVLLTLSAILWCARIRRKLV